ncbi:MAG: sigma-70 family RNA polymerase sigma factor [Selenomonadales bacterium]|nr:sigma-70 family RNA polymerase sigma factor [Selenomonadales bacterium]
MENQRFIKIDGEQIPVTEEVYRAYKRPAWAERKRQERSKRCVISNGKDGTKRCTDDCSKCDKQRTGSVLSLNKFIDDGYEITDPVDLAEFVADKLLLEQLVAALDELEPDERSLIDALFYKERTERDYAAEIGISHQAVGKRKHKVIEKLRGIMGADK